MSEDLFAGVKPILRHPHLRLKMEQIKAHQQVPIVIVGEVVRNEGPEKFVLQNSKGKGKR